MPPGAVTVHRCPLDLEGPPSGAALAWLDPEETGRAAGFGSERAGRRYVASHAALRAVLAVTLGVGRDEVRYDRSCEHCGHPAHGRPRLAGADADSPDFSLSHSGGWAVIAVGPGPLGADVEALGRRPVSPRVIERMTTAAEKARLPPKGAPERYDVVLELWTRKEAVGKALGLGVTLAFDTFDADLRTPITAGGPGGPTLELWSVALDGAVGSVAAPAGVPVHVDDGTVPG